MLSTLISICALVLTAYGLYQTYNISMQMAQRSEDKQLIDELINVIKEIDNQSSHYLLTYNKDRSSPKLYIARITSLSNIAQYLAFELKETRKLLNNNIDDPLSNLHLNATFNMETIHSATRKKECSHIYSLVNKSYLDCIRVLHQAFHSKYKP